MLNPNYSDISTGFDPQGTLFNSITNGATNSNLLSSYNPTTQLPNDSATLGSTYALPMNQELPDKIPYITQQQTNGIGDNSFLKSALGNSFDPHMGTLGNSLTLLNQVGGVVGGLMNLYSAWQSIGLANKKMDMLDQQMKIVNEQWADAQKERAYMRKARLKIANKFNGVN